VNTYAQANVDLVPQCSSNAVPLNDEVSVTLIFYGDGSWSPSELRRPRVRLAGAPARSGEWADVDSDGEMDLIATFYTSDMSLLRTMSTTALFSAWMADGTVYIATPTVSPGSWSDTDDDGVLDPCDACSGTPSGTAVGWDGCP
jgi:hypothetical protein